MNANVAREASRERRARAPSGRRTSAGDVRPTAPLDQRPQQHQCRPRVARPSPLDSILSDTNGRGRCPNLRTSSPLGRRRLQVIMNGGSRPAALAAPVPAAGPRDLAAAAAASRRACREAPGRVLYNHLSGALQKRHAGRADAPEPRDSPGPAGALMFAHFGYLAIFALPRAPASVLRLPAPSVSVALVLATFAPARSHAPFLSNEGAHMHIPRPGRRAPFFRRERPSRSSAAAATAQAAWLSKVGPPRAPLTPLGLTFSFAQRARFCSSRPATIKCAALLRAPVSPAARARLRSPAPSGATIFRANRAAAAGLAQGARGARAGSREFVTYGAAATAEGRRERRRQRRRAT